MQTENYFKVLDFTDWSGKTVIIDIDGTITTDGSSNFDPLVLKNIQELSINNSIFLFSNKKLTDRDNLVSNKLNIPLIKTPFKKPNKMVIDKLPDNLKRNLVVVGDKVFIDGLFAKNIQAKFIKVKRLTSKKDSLKTRLIYLMDNIINYFTN